jgi:DNA repair protein RecO (recombination protein O)
MQVKTKAIVISSMRYQEKSLIVKCFTQSDGLKSYFVPNAFAAKKSNQKIAYFQPLTQLEIVATHKKKGTLEHFKEIRLSHSYQSIPTDIAKSTIAIFLSEIFYSAIKEEEKNESLFTFLETALLWLDTHNETANFHLIIMLELSKFLGFYPGKSNQENDYFEMTEGVFVPFQGVSCLNQQESFLLKKLIDLKFDSSQKIFIAAQRQVLLKILLDYYSVHLSGFKSPKSLEVLKEVFA